MDIPTVVSYLGSPAHVSTEHLSVYQMILFVIRSTVSLIGGVVILLGSATAITKYTWIWLCGGIGARKNVEKVDQVRLLLGQAISLGLEFIVAADVIETTEAPDYYSVGILCIVVAIRTVSNYFLTKEITRLEKVGSR